MTTKFVVISLLYISLLYSCYIVVRCVSEPEEQQKEATLQFSSLVFKIKENHFMTRKRLYSLIMQINHYSVWLRAVFGSVHKKALLFLKSTISYLCLQMRELLSSSAATKHNLGPFLFISTFFIVIAIVVICGNRGG